MSIVVCPLSRVDAMVALHRPARVISMLDPDRPFPELGPRYAGAHLRLSFHDIEVASTGVVAPAAGHVRELLAFIRAWDPVEPLLIHCRAGISRSTATAYIAACMKRPEVDEHDVAVALRDAAPLARPNGTLVRLADAEMARNGRMSEAIDATGRGLPWIEVDEGEPFRMMLL